MVKDFQVEVTHGGIVGGSSGPSYDGTRLAIDACLLVTLVGTAVGGEVVVWFHLVFLTTTVAAFQLDHRTFLRRAVPALAIVTAVLVRDWHAGDVPFDEVLELPILSAVAALINVVAVRRARLVEEVAHSDQTLRQLQQERFAEFQDRQLFDLSVESTGWLTASATHDLNNILAMILANSESIAAHHPDAVEHGTAQIDHAVDAARQLVSGIADLTGTGNVDSWCDLNEVVQDTLELHAPMGSTDVRVELRLTDSDARVHLPRVLAYQIVSNLVVNAQDAMPDGGVLHVETAVSDDQSMIELTVTDTGLGMSESVRDRAFDPHFTTRPIGGSGVGLYTVGRIVDAAGGSIDLVTAPGEGTSFTVGLPGGAGPPVRIPRAAQSRAASIMLVEDEALLRERWADSIGSHGYRVIGVNDAQAALLSIHEDGVAPDVLVTDYSMPGMNGLELIESLRRESPDLPVVLVSGLLPGLPDDWSDHPVNAFVAKPCSVTQLLDAIERVLDEMRGANGERLLER
jgi:two-component system cell cycle sensor histidine kinase/response regulator CckA